LNIAPQTSPELADINGDLREDLIVGCGNGFYYCYENLGTGTEPQWEVWSSYKVWPGIEYYDPISYINYLNHSFADKFAQLILDASIPHKDEVAFSIAHTSTQVLQHPDTYPDLYKRNAELLYEIDGYLDYANIVDYGSYNDRDYYSTVKYDYKAKNSSIIQSTELPRDIYYWYVVHPKITDEIPTYINPNTGNPAPPPIGRFWREYLFYHNDSVYPPDPHTDPNDDGIPNFHYPKEEAPPLLKEKLSGITYVYDSQPYNAPRGYDNQGYNNTRPWGYKDHAIEVVSNWVGKTLPLNEQESADGERPIQPVRIARHHNGNCGELQDLSVAGARTALIAAGGDNLLAEDHVWNEFYDRGWHQWDNYWSDGGSVVDNFMNYWVVWGQRSGSGVTKWRGDDFTWQVTDKYVPAEDLSTITVYVRDRNGYPVDGARVMVHSHWTSVEMSGYQVTIPFPSIWNYTDNNGSCTFKVATQEGMAEGNKNFSFKVISKLGNAEQGKTELQHGQDYEFFFTLEGQKPERNLEYTVPYVEIEDTPQRFFIMLYYEETGAYQQPPNPMVGNYHPQGVGLGSEINFYMFNETNFNYYRQSNYKSGEPVSCVPVQNSASGSNLAYLLLDNDDWYLVGYNKNTLETLKKGRVTLHLYEQQDEFPEVKILTPMNGQEFQSGEEITISGEASDDRGIERLTLSIEGEKHDITSSLIDINWSYVWDTEGYTEGMYNITIMAYDTNGNGIGIGIRIILTPPPPPPPVDTKPPVIELIAPTNGSTFTIGETVQFKGSAEDESEITSLVLTIDSKPFELSLGPNETLWSYSYDTSAKDEGKCRFNIRAIDSSGNTERVFGYIILEEEYIDYLPPVLEILKPTSGETFEVGDTIVIEGIIEDDVGVESLMISTVTEQWEDITFSITGMNWIYKWSTEGADLDIGMHTIVLMASDTSGNTDDIEFNLLFLDLTAPEISIIRPLAGAEYTQGIQTELRGYCNDEFGIDRVELTISSSDVSEKIRKGIVTENSEWSYTWDVTDYYPPGDYTLTATATDLVGNTDTVTLDFKIIAPAKAKDDKDTGFFGLPGFEGWIFIFALVGLLFLIKSSNYSHGNKK
jgi:hypothetical protein